MLADFLLIHFKAIGSTFSGKFLWDGITSAHYTSIKIKIEALCDTSSKEYVKNNFKMNDGIIDNDEEVVSEKIKVSHANIIKKIIGSDEKNLK